MITATIYGASLLLRLEAVQKRAADAVTLILQELGDFPISIGAVQVQHLNKVVIKDIALTDEEGDTALAIPKITAHLSPLYMLKGDIHVNTLMIGEPTIALRRKTANSPLNIQFIIDKLASDSSGTTSYTPNLRINQIQMYDGTFSYDIEQEERRENGFDAAHIKVEKFTCNLSLKKLTGDTLSLYIRSVSGRESKGFTLDRLSAKVNAGPARTDIKELLIKFPQSRITAKRATIISKKNGTFTIDGTLHSDKLTPADFASFLPTLSAAGLPTVAFKASISGNNRNSGIATSITTSDNSVSLQLNARIKELLSPKESAITITDCVVTPTAIGHLQTIVNDSTGTFTPLKQLGNITLRGTADASDNIRGEFTIDSDGGTIQGNATIDNRQECTATLNMQGIKLNRILQNEKLGSCNIATHIQGSVKKEEPAITLTSTISSFSYNGYTYAPINIEATHNNEHTGATISSNDTNATGHIAFLFTHRNRNEIKITASIDSIKPDSLHIGAGDNGTISGTVDGTYTGYDDGKSLFDLRIYNIMQQIGRRKKNIRMLHIVDNNLLDNRSLIINSDFLDGKIAGRFSYPALVGTFNNIAHTHLPTLFDGKAPASTDNAYAFNFNINNTAIISNLLNLPITIHNRSVITGLCDDNRKHFHADIKLADTHIDEHTFDSISTTLFANDSIATITGTLKTTNSLTINMRATAHCNNINTALHWANDTTPVNRGTLNTNITLTRKENKMEAEAHIAPGNIIYNNTPWNISECTIKGNSDEVSIANLHISNNQKSLYAHGKLGSSDDDIFDIKLNDIKLESLLDLADFHSVEFGGNATGGITLHRAFDSPQFNSKLQVDSFTFEKGYMGDLTFNAEWKNEEKAVAMRGDIHTPDKAHTVVHGFVSPANDTISLCIDADRARLAFLNSMLEGIVSDVDATATGRAYLTGQLGHLNLIGEVVATGPLRITSTNVTYLLLNDTIKLTPNKLSFNNGLLADKFGHTGSVTGSIDHLELGDWACDLDITAKNLLAYHCEDFGSNPFHGTAFATGDANITVNDKGLFIHANIRSERNSTFVYDASSIGASTSSNFIKFTDRNKKRLTALQREREEIEAPDKRKSLLSRLNLEFMIEVTPDMQLKVYTNRKTGDYIDLYGTGPITAVYDEKDGFTMQGMLDLERGTYKFTMQDIFPKEFDITEGSTLEFNGDPFQAALNLKTRYLVPSASLSDLDPTGKRHKSVKVHCLMDITGKLEAPQLNFDIELPDANEEQRELLASAVSTPEQKNMQFIYLMGIGKFYTYDYNRTDGNAESSSAMESLISNTISGQLNNMLSRIIDNRNWNISGNFSSSERGWNSMEVEGILEGRLLDNRLLINGNFGYRENPLANSNFVGDFEVQWLLDRNGNVSLKAYNKTNDRYFSDATLTTQGAGIILRHNFDEWRWWLRNKKKNKTEETEK